MKKKEALQQHVLENYEKDLACVQELERKLNINIHWKPKDAEWQHTGRLVANRECQQALDRLEGLVVTWIFELLKMNRAGTAAHAMNLPKCQLHWDKVIKYTFLSKCEEQLRTTNTPLAHQISIRRNVHSHFDTLHLKYLYNILQLPGFTGMLAPGVSALKAIRDSATIPSVTIPMCLASLPLPQPSILQLQTTDMADELEEEEDIEENVVQAGCALQDIIHLTMDIEHTN
ncbi:hypothetical protein EDC04DRAFT_2873314 [Pisolithus marmoratus]|nr:hypothetical protein EDC04DRAFT_2873314 [Pisolithus marmoratus]